MNLLQLSFWFNVRPIPLLPLFDKLFIASIAFLGVLLVIIAIAKRSYKGIYGAVLDNLVSLLSTNFIIGLLLYFFNYELVPFLSARFWLILWALEMIVWIYFIIERAKVIPQRKEQIEKEREYKKYIPQ